MLHFTVPTFTPRALEELHSEPDEVSSLVYMEDAIAKEVSAAACAAGSTRAPRPPCGARADRGARPWPAPLQLTTIREHNKNAVPLGQLPQQDEEPEEPEDDRNAAGPGSSEPRRRGAAPEPSRSPCTPPAACSQPGGPAARSHRVAPTPWSTGTVFSPRPPSLSAAASTEGVSDQDGMESAGSDVELDMI